MADNMFEEGVQWFSAKLRILEADYEKSKLQVLQDTLLCKRSMIELELLCKNEQLRKNTRVNNRIKESEFELQEQLKSLSVDLESATNQLQTVQNTLQDEKTQHNLEKKELEEKLSLEMEKRMEEQKKNAGHREKLLQEEIKNLQDEQVKTFREAEDLRMELRRKNVPVKAKAVQTQVTVKHASTMAQVDSQTSDVGLQAQSAAGELPPMNSENGQGTDEAVHGNIESGKGGKEVAGLTGRNKKRKATDGDQEKGLKNRNEEAKKKKKEADKGKESEGIVGEKTKNERKSSSTRREITTSPSKVTAEAGKQNRLCDRTTIGDPFLSFSASQEDGVSLQYNKTPRLRKKSNESDLSLENNRQKSNVNNVLLDNTPALNTESVAAKKQSEGMSSKVCFENGSNHTSKGKEEEEGRATGFDEEAVKKYSARRTSLLQQIVEEQQSQVQKEDSMEDREEATCKTKMAGTGKEVQNKESKRTAKEKKRTMKENSEYSRANKTKEVEAAEDEILRDKNPTEKEKSVKRIEDQNNDSENRRVLRSRTKKRNSGVEISPCKGQGDDVNNKSFAKNSRQIPHDIDGISAAKKCKTDDTWSKGHEPAMLLTSSPEDHQFPRKTELSSSEIDTLVDETHPSPGAKTRATSDDTSQQPETEIQESERVRDYNSCRESLVVDDNRIKEVVGKINSESLHSAMERVKSKKCSCEENDTETSNREEKIEQKTELFSKKCRKSKRTLKKGGYGNDACTSRRQDSSAFFTDNDTRSTRQKNKSATSHRGHSRRKELKHTGQPAIALEKTDATLKENAPSEKSAGKKRKPNQCVHEVPAPADLQPSPDGTTSTESSSVLDNTKKRKTLFNARENSLMVSASKVQISFTNTTLSKGRTNTGIPPSLSAFMRSFIAPKLKKSF